VLSAAAIAVYVSGTFVAPRAVLGVAVALAGIALHGGLACPSAWTIASFGTIVWALNAIPGFGATWPLPLLVALGA
jgi:hypothetical protein